MTNHQIPFGVTEDPLAELSEQQQLYKENILDHYRHPRNQKKLSVFTHRMHDTNPLCGDRVTVYLLIKDGIIVDCAFEGSGCAISQASTSILTEYLRGKSRTALIALGQKEIVELLGIPIGPVRLKCAMLGLRAMQKSLQEEHHA